MIGKLRVWKRVGFFIMIGCGLLLAGSEADKYIINPYFWVKMTLLVLLGVHGLIFHRSVYYNTAELDQAPSIPGRAKLAAALSLVLWIGVVSFGRMIGYYEAPSGPHGPEAAQAGHFTGSTSGRSDLRAGFTPSRVSSTNVPPNLNR